MLQRGAAGYTPIAGSIYAPTRIASAVMTSYLTCALTPQIARSNFLADEEILCGDKVIFGRQTDLDFFAQEVDNNEDPETMSGPGVETDSLRVCQQRKYKIKVSNEDRRLMCGNFGAWEENMRRNVERGIKRLIDTYSISKIMASTSPDNWGSRAGKLTHSINLGTQGQEALDANSPQGFLDMIYSMDEVAQEAGWSCGEGTVAIDGTPAEPVLLVPHLFGRYAKQMLSAECCAGADGSPIRTGMIGYINGYATIHTTQLVPVTIGSVRLVPVIMLDPTRILHVFDMITNKWYEGEFEDYMLGQFVWETAVLDPHAVIVAWSKI